MYPPTNIYRLGIYVVWRMGFAVDDFGNLVEMNDQTDFASGRE